MTGYPIPAGVPVTPNWARDNNEDETPLADRERDLWEPYQTAGLHVGANHDRPARNGAAGHERELTEES